MPEFSNYVESLDAASTTTGTILIPASHDGDPESFTPAQIVAAGGGGGVSDWGDIGGTLSNQIDLQTALDAKQTSAQVSSAITAATVGVQDLFYSAKGGAPRTSNGCSVPTLIEFATSLVNLYVLAFDQTTAEFAQFDIVPPRKWNNGPITVIPHWTAQSGSGTVRWAVNGGMFRNDDALTTAMGAAQNSDDTLLATNDFHSGPETSAITLAGTGADGNLVVIQVGRDPTNDTLNADALLIGITIRWTTDAAIDG